MRILAFEVRPAVRVHCYVGVVAPEYRCRRLSRKVAMDADGGDLGLVRQAVAGDEGALTFLLAELWPRAKKVDFRERAAGGYCS